MSEINIKTCGECPFGKSGWCWLMSDESINVQDDQQPICDEELRDGLIRNCYKWMLEIMIKREP